MNRLMSNKREQAAKEKSKNKPGKCTTTRSLVGFKNKPVSNFKPSYYLTSD
jgi:hypothetical protein